ncbi:methylamine utilization protein [Sphingomonas ginkgonis]|uniref:Methylamine utilization protein n=1 Tax=Sphingomonas ginkgonis TaxID=2315330 RepID=A0A429V8D1_9SPHN|nr:methylamine utilization protein [Sphingomonas ginkgonis]RST30199.1 methylamine utilization protein [Sphingomonas ginkgonis]
MYRVILLPLCLASAAAHATTATFVARDPAGRPLSDAVVTVRTATRPAGPIRFPWPMVMGQQDLSYTPHVLIVPVGATVSFPNRDRVRHHVYSVSKPKKFAIRLYGHEEQRTETFDRPGAVALGCNIHDQMSGFIYVVDTPFAATTNAQGMVRFANLPEGAATVTVWSPSLRMPGNSWSGPLRIAGPNLMTSLVARR